MKWINPKQQTPSKTGRCFVIAETDEIDGTFFCRDIYSDIYIAEQKKFSSELDEDEDMTYTVLYWCPCPELPEDANELIKVFDCLNI